jgi:uncharacterized membrane protein YedE/YeeE
MTIDWTHFTPWPSLAGGLLIGVAAAAFVLLHGRIAGISSIVGGMLGARGGQLAWRFAFIAGLIAAPTAWLLIGVTPVPRINAPLGALVVSGLLVGLGTSYGSGCTSGHGVCGLSRLSLRSLVATLTFMLAGFATVFVLRHLVS